MSELPSVMPPTSDWVGPSRITTVFLDRDGVINEEAGIIRDASQIRLVPGSAAAIRRMNLMGIRVVVVTNQPVVARGWATEEEVEAMHEHLHALLLAEGATWDAIYYCPHHENADLPAYRLVCECRKPRPGLLLLAANEWEIDLSSSVMVGDRTVDLRAGREAGCAGVFLVRTGFGGSDGKCEERPDRVFDDLGEFAHYLEKCLNNR